MVTAMLSHAVTCPLCTGNRLSDMHCVQVATTLHRLEQAKYWSGLKQKHSNQNLASKQRSAIEGQMADCMRSTEAPPAAELLAMVQAGCEEEVGHSLPQSLLELTQQTWMLAVIME